MGLFDFLKKKPSAKPIARPAAKPIAKAVAKPVAKPAAKPITKAVAKPVAKPTAKPIAKTVAKPSAGPAVKPITKPAPQKQRRTSPAYQPGRPGNKTTIVLSAPGSAEKKAGKPAAGQTGKNLNAILTEANKKDPKTFPSSNKDDYTIVNATNKVHYKRKTGSTEATSKELNKPKNIQRVKAVLKGQKTVVAFGKKAQEVVQAAGYNGNVLKGSHPSYQNINRNHKSDKPTPSERSKDRIKQVVEDLLDQKKDSAK